MGIINWLTDMVDVPVEVPTDAPVPLVGDTSPLVVLAAIIAT
jgi:hypothetical protein